MSPVNWEHVARAELHPLRVRIIEHAEGAREPFSPSQLADRFGAPLGNVAYHVRRLRAEGLLEATSRRMRGGVVEHFYRASTGLID
jgi:DNA-binding transcriptional ArsR family regulator